MSHIQGTLFYIHGANISPSTLAWLTGRLEQGLAAHGMADVRLVAPAWRQNSGMVLGPVDLTIPPAPERMTKTGGDLVTGLEARLAALAPLPFDVQALVWRAFTNYFDDRRPELMRLIGNQLLGDSLAYQVYRTPILEFVGSQLAAVSGPGPVVAVGESLGGLILLELLSVPSDLTPVKGLVTIGNPAPVLYALSAIEALPYDGDRAPYGPWWNLYDPRDFLSFVAAPIFRRYETHIEDVRIESGEPFPKSHGAYWDEELTWETIRGAFGFPEAQPRD
jgi:hypothetical protein